MKPSVILTVTAVLVATVTVHRHRHLSALKEETQHLAQPDKLPPSGPRRHVVESSADAPKEQAELVRETLIEFLTSQIRPGGPGLENTERGKQFLLAAMIFSARDISTVVDSLQADPRMAGASGEKIVPGCHELFGDVAPFAWREYLTTRRDLPNWQDLFNQVSRNCLRVDGRRALTMIEREAAQGNTAVATTAIRSSMLQELATTDPDKMLQLAASPDFTADPDALLHLGGFVDDRFESPADHSRFLSALQRAQEKNPSPLLTTIREDYTREMAGQFSGWPAADAISLIDSQFTPDERFAVAEQSASRIDLVDKEQWVDWFLKIDTEEWSAWAKRHGHPSKHPLVRQIESQAIKDSQTPRQWLEKIPPGPLKDEAVLAYCWMIADRDPGLAAGYLDRIPPDKRKQDLIRKIGEAKR